MPNSAFLNYWHSHRNDGNLPSWSEFASDPSGQIFRRLAMHEIPNEASLHCRFFGSLMVELWDRDMTGENLLETMPDSPSLKNAAMIMRIAATHPCGAEVKGTWATKNGRTFFRKQMYLPIQATASGIPRILTYSNQERITFNLKNEHPFGVSEYKFDSWIDLGWGIPDTVSIPGE